MQYGYAFIICFEIELEKCKRQTSKPSHITFIVMNEDAYRVGCECKTILGNYCVAHTALNIDRFELIPSIPLFLRFMITGNHCEFDQFNNHSHVSFCRIFIRPNSIEFIWTPNSSSIKNQTCFRAHVSQG